MAWDDDQLDRPDGQPAPGWKPSRTDRHRAADLVEDAEWVRQHGGYRLATAAVVAARLGVSTDRLEHAYVRARRHAARDAQPQAEAI